MNKIKRMWNNNRVLIVLALIVFLCLGIMSVVMVKYFFGGSTSSYGDRLEDIADLPFKEEDQETLKNKIFEDDSVADVTINVKGKIIYVRILFNSAGTLDHSKEVAVKSLKVISPDYQAHYDLNYTIVKDSTEEAAGFTLMGAKNINRTAIVWNNNTPVSTEE